MSKVNDEIVPVPQTSRVYQNRRVVDLTVVSTRKDPQKKLIGWLCPPEKVPLDIIERMPEGTRFMNPNDSYYDLHGTEYLEFNPNGHEKVKKQRLAVGLYALVLTIAIKTGLYQTLTKNYGFLAANAIMDYAMYAIFCRTDEPKTFTELMANHVCFSVVPYSDSWYSQFFQSGMSEDINGRFREDWLNYNLKHNMIHEVAISAYGMSVDCGPEENPSAAQDNATVLWTVIAEGPHKGMPVTYTICSGNDPVDAQLNDMLALWKKQNVQARVLLTDRGILDDELLTTLQDKHIEFTAKLQESSEGFQTMFEKYGEALPLNVRYVLEGGISGVTEDHIRPYKHSEQSFCAGLFYDFVQGAKRRASMLEEVRLKKQELEQDLNSKSACEKSDKEEEKDNRDIHIPEFFKIVDKSGLKTVEIAYDLLQEKWTRQGYYSLITSVHMSPQEMNKDYDLFNTLEEQISLLKSQEEEVHVETRAGWENKLFVDYITAVIRNEIVLACREEKLDTNLVISFLENVIYNKIDGYYWFLDAFPGDTRELFEHFGIDQSLLEGLSVYVNNRYGLTEEQKNRIRNQMRTLSEGTSKKGSAVAETVADEAHSESDTAVSKKKKGGRKPGSKNKKTLERERLKREQRIAAGLPPEEEPSEKRKPGRPKGSKNKKTLEREQQERERRMAAGLPPEEKKAEKRKRGRPKGSKNKKTLEREQRMAAGLPSGEESGE